MSVVHCNMVNNIFQYPQCINGSSGNNNPFLAFFHLSDKNWIMAFLSRPSSGISFTVSYRKSSIGRD